MKLFLILILFLLCVFDLHSQSDTTKKYITIIPGQRYEANWLHRIFFGAHWRDVWTTPIKVEVLDLKNFAGGLTPVSKGGGFQTKSLQLKSNDGRIWKFRSVDKDPSKILPEDLQETVAEDIIQDQISTSNPLAPLVVIPLLEAVNVLESKPKLVYMSDDEKLGEFREEFKNMLGFIEEHPTEGIDGDPGFANALDVKGTYHLFNYLAEKRNQKIDSQEFLKARLMDILLGDWDRHMDQWRWAKYEEADGKIWKPIPRDRDQAFSKYDGFFPTIADYWVPQLEHFGYDFPQVEDLTWNGRFLDWRVLTELDKRTWDSVTTFVKNSITDEVIDNAVKQLPSEIYTISGEEISSKLKSRRDQLQYASDKFFYNTNKFADVYCSDEDDFVEVNRLDDKSTIVSVYKRDKDSGEKKDKPLFYKIFDNEITIDLRIFLNDGDDKAIVFGKCNYGPVIRVIGGKGKDEFTDESVVYGYFFSITPFTAVQRRTYFYDSGENTLITEGPGTVYDDYEWKEPESDLEKYEPKQRDRGHNWLPVPILSYDTDYGVTVGGGVQLYKYNFREIPEEYVQQLTASFATSTSTWNAAYDGNFYSLVRSGRLNLSVTATEQFFIRYFGYGNESSFESELEEKNYYRVNQKLFSVFPTMYYSFSNSVTGSIGVSFIQTETSTQNDSLLSGFKYDDYGLGSFNPVGFHLSLNFNDLDNNNFPTKGFGMNLHGSYFPKVLKVEEAFYSAGFDLKTYLTPSFLSSATLALRTGGSKVFGKYPFFSGAVIGGTENLRGYNAKRFSGDAALFGQADLRIFLTQMKVILKSRFGINLFAETGRVFTETESKKWHPSYGFGIWLAYFNSTVVGTSYVAFSPERTTFALGLGMGF